MIQPKRCRDKHHATPKRPKNKPKTRIRGGVTSVSSFPRQLSVVAGVTVGQPGVSQVTNNASNKTMTLTVRSCHIASNGTTYFYPQIT